MVRMTSVLLRVPVIKFRKGGMGSSSSPLKPGSCPATAPASASRAPVQAAPMSTGTILDIDLPLRYRRQPMSQEEIDHINGGGIKDPNVQYTKEPQPAVTIIRVPRGLLIEPNIKREECIKLNIVLQKGHVKKR